MRSRNLILSAALATMLLGGCSLAPEYHRPGMPVAENFPAIGDELGINKKHAEVDAADLGWRDYFLDPNLQKLIEAALANNRDLRETALNVQAYQAQYRIQRSELFPQVDGSGSAAKQRSFTGAQYATTETYGLSVGVTAYELDFFGRIRNLEAQALEQYLAMEETHRSAHISLVAEVAKAYLTWMADREILAITEDTRRTEAESYNLVKQRNAEGLATQMEVAQSRTSLETANANLALYERLVAQDFNNLTLLVGGGVPAEITTRHVPVEEQMPLSILPRRLSSQILLQRPDIVAAEHELRGDNANIGAARAAFFPSVSLSMNAGTMNNNFSGLFDSGTGTWLFSPSINIPIFTAGRLKAQLDVAEIRKEISVARYEKAIQTAFREVADTLTASAAYIKEVEAKKAYLEANKSYYSLAKERYTQGVDSFLTLLDAQRSLYGARQDYVTVRLAELVNRVDLYKALGGGWQERTVKRNEEVKAEAPPPISPPDA